MRGTNQQKRRAMSLGEVSEDGLRVQYSTTALIIVLLSFFALCSYFSSPVLVKAALNVVIVIHNGTHLELAGVASPPPSSIPDQNPNPTEQIIPSNAEIENQPKTEVKVTGSHSFEHHHHPTSASKSRCLCFGCWGWFLRLMLMSFFCLMVGEDSRGGSTPPPEEDKSKSSSGPSKEPNYKQGKRKRILLEAFESEKKMAQDQNEKVQDKEKSEAHRIEIEGILGGPNKVYEYFRDEVFRKKCQEENRTYTEAEAEEAWRGVNVTERIGYVDDALAKYYLHDENLEGLLSDNENNEDITL